MSEKDSPLWKDGYRAGVTGISFRGYRPRTTDPDSRRILRNGWINGRAVWRKQNPPVPVNSRRLDQRYLGKLCDKVNAELQAKGLSPVCPTVCKTVLEQHGAR